MQYIIRSIKIIELLDMIKNDTIDLKPYYQRNDIWSRKDQELLIDSICKGFPLPSFFIFQRTKGHFEMVDGQQRTRTIMRFINEKITNSEKSSFSTIDRENFLNYKLCITEIYNVENDKEIEYFYVLVNKRGKHLTTPELHKAEFAGTNFLETVEGLLEYQNLMDLNLFTEATTKRMSDRNFIEELVAYLIYGIQDKKKIIERIYKDDITEDKKEIVENDFCKVIDKIHFLNELFPIHKTRYKQRNDFYTLFNFVYENINQSNKLFEAQYNTLLAIAPYVSPSNNNCPPLKNYALNCVSQSNSKNAREERLNFFNAILLNKEDDISKNDIVADIANYIDSFNLFELKFQNVDGLTLISNQ